MEENFIPSEENNFDWEDFDEESVYFEEDDEEEYHEEEFVDHVEDDDYFYTMRDNFFRPNSTDSLTSIAKIYKDIFKDDPDSPNKIKIRLERRSLEEKERNVSAYMTTVGTEIEIPRHGITQNVREKVKKKNPTAQDYYNVYDEISSRYGIPQGNDSIFEIATFPSNNPEVQSRLIHELCVLGYLNPEHKKYAMHVSVGGISEFENARYLMLGLYGTGWSTTERRLKMQGPRVKGKGTLLMKVIKNNFSSIALPQGSDFQNSRVVSEMRGFTFRGLREFHNTVKTASLLGAAAKAYEVPPEDRDKIQEKLAFAWEDYFVSLKKIYRDYGIEIPRETGDFSKDKENNDKLIDKLAEELGKSERNESPFSYRVRQLVRETRKNVANIVPFTS